MNVPSLVFVLFLGLAGIRVFAQVTAPDLYTKEYNSGNFPNALALAREAIKAEPNGWRPYYIAGVASLQLGKERDGVKMLEKAVALNGSSAEARAALAYGYLLRNNKKATDEADEALKLDKKNPEANYVLAAMAIRNETYNVAYDRSKAAIAASPKMSVAYFTKSQSLVSSFIKQRGTVLKNESRAEMLNEAAADLEEFLRLQPQNKNVQFYREYIESLRFFAEYYSRSENKLPDADAAAGTMEPNRTSLKIISRQRAPYTDAARSAGIQGTVMLLVGFSSDGTVKHVLLTKPLGYGLDEGAVAAARAMKFEPETIDGKAVSTVRPVSFTFNIR